MSIADLGIQAVALTRKQVPKKIEKEGSKYNSLKMLRQEAGK